MSICNSKFIKKIISLKNIKENKVLTIFGCSFGFKNPKYLAKQLAIAKELALDVVNSSVLNKIPTKTVLISEMNGSCHGELISGLYEYLNALGYNVDIALSDINYNRGALDHLKGSNQCRIFTVNNENWNKFWANENIKNYENIILNSHYVYSVNPKPEFSSTEKTVDGEIYINSAFTLFPSLKKWYEKIILLEHHQEHIDADLMKDKKIFSFVDCELSLANNIPYINPHYFKDVEIKTKDTNFTKFIVVGHIQNFRKDINSIIDAVEKLDEKGVNNFKVVFIGSGNPEIKNKNILKYFEVKGGLSYEEMYNEIEQADYILPLLNPHNEVHCRYIKNCGSGSFQHVYAFSKPCVTAKKFADTYFLDYNSSVIHEDANDFTDALLKAIQIKSEEYAELCTSLRALSENLKEKSKQNLKEMLACNKKKG